MTAAWVFALVALSGVATLIAVIVWSARHPKPIDTAQWPLGKDEK